MRNFGEEPKKLEFDEIVETDQKDRASSKNDSSTKSKKVVPPKEDEYLWMWKVRFLLHEWPDSLRGSFHSLNLRLLGELFSSKLHTLGVVLSLLSRDVAQQVQYIYMY